MGQDVLRNFTKFTGKHLCQCLFFNNVADLKSRLLDILDKHSISKGSVLIYLVYAISNIDILIISIFKH